MRDTRGAADSHVNSYRPDIDGMRAIAVISVVFYHLSSNAIPGGFLGVDIFFVISGYLITQIIWKESSIGKFSLAKFYERRIRRIMPPLIFVLVVCCGISTLVLLPVDLIGFAKSLLATLTFTANIYFWRDSDYFSRAAGEKPLLHLWSLGVEEQFYLLFPFVILFCARFLKTRAYLFVIVLAAISFVLNMLLLRIGGSEPAFYLIPARAWELAAGAALAMGAPSAPKPFVAFIFGVIGLACIAVGFVLGRNLSIYNIPAPTVAVIGAILLIWTGLSDKSFVRVLLASPVMVFFGLISYSLYLWHWPIIVLSKYWLVADLNGFETAVDMGLMFAMAWLSWRFVERPFRSRRISIKLVLAFTVLATAGLSSLAAAVIRGDGFPQRLNQNARQIDAAVGTYFRCPLNEYMAVGLARGCAIALPSRNAADADVALIGNSHAMMYSPVLADELAARKLHGVLINANRCLPSMKWNLNPVCLNQARDYIEAAKGLRAKVVFIGLAWETHDRLYDRQGRAFSGSTIEGEIAGVADTVNELAKAGKTVVLIGPIAEPGWDVSSTLSRSMAFGRPLSRPLYEDRSQFAQYLDPVLHEFDDRSDVVLLRPDLVQCATGRCDYVRGNVGLFSDESHLSRQALTLFRPRFSSALDTALSRAGSGPSQNSSAATPVSQ